MIAPNQGFASGVFIHKMEILRFLKLKHYTLLKTAKLEGCVTSKILIVGPT